MADAELDFGPSRTAVGHRPMANARRAGVSDSPARYIRDRLRARPRGGRRSVPPRAGTPRLAGSLVGGRVFRARRRGGSRRHVARLFWSPVRAFREPALE